MNKPLVSLLLAGILTAPWTDHAAAASLNDSTLALGTRGMVSSAHPIATDAGLTILSQGGNAFDAAIAVASTLNVVEPQNSGVGGYGIILIYDAAAKRVRVLNTSGRFPAAVDADVFRHPHPGYEENRRSAKAISTPTNANAYAALYENYGHLPWNELFAPAIDAASEGHRINGSVSRAIASNFEKFSEYSRAIYGKEGTPLGEGDWLVQHDLADALTLIAKYGVGVIYGGDIGKAIDRAARERGSFLRMSDLLRNRAEWWEPIHIDYRGHEVFTASPPGNSFSSLIRLGIMEHFDLAALGHNSVEYLHLFAEVTKHAYWCRLNYAGDPEVKAPPLKTLLSDAYFAAEAAKINRDRSTDFLPPGLSAPTGQHTTHFVVADQLGNIVSATQTLGGGFGSKVQVEGTGIWLNNSMYFCTFEPKGNPMDAHPGRRKLNSNHPTIVFRDGKPIIAIGTPGGHTIGQTVPQMIMNMIDFGMNVQEAIAAPRVAFTEPNTLRIEETLSEEIASSLTSLGHEIKTTRAIGNGHGLTIAYDEAGNPIAFTGSADPRGAGLAKGL